jgi:hypothetical protein
MNLAKQPQGETGMGGVMGFLHGLGGHVGIGGIAGNTVDKTIGQIADVAIMSVPSLFQLGSDVIHEEWRAVGDVLHDPNVSPSGTIGHFLLPKATRRVATAMGQQLYTDVRHPIRQIQKNPGYLAADVFAVASLGMAAPAKFANAASFARTGGPRVPTNPLIGKDVAIGKDDYLAQSLLQRGLSKLRAGTMDRRNKWRERLNMDQTTIAPHNIVAANEAVAAKHPAAFHSFMDQSLWEMTRAAWAADHELRPMDQIPWGPDQIEIVKTGTNSDRTVAAIGPDGKPTGVFATLTTHQAGKEWANIFGANHATSEPVWAIFDVRDTSKLLGGVGGGEHLRAYTQLKQKIANGKKRGTHYAESEAQKAEWEAEPGYDPATKIEVLSENDVRLVNGGKPIEPAGLGSNQFGVLGYVRQNNLTEQLRNLAAEQRNTSKGLQHEDDAGLAGNVSYLQGTGTDLYSPLQGLEDLGAEAGADPRISLSNKLLGVGGEKAAIDRAIVQASDASVGGARAGGTSYTLPMNPLTADVPHASVAPDLSRQVPGAGFVTREPAARPGDVPLMFRSQQYSFDAAAYEAQRLAEETVPGMSQVALPAVQRAEFINAKLAAEEAAAAKNAPRVRGEPLVNPGKKRPSALSQVDELQGVLVQDALGIHDIADYRKGIYQAVARSTQRAGGVTPVTDVVVGSATQRALDNLARKMPRPRSKAVAQAEEAVGSQQAADAYKTPNEMHADVVAEASKTATKQMEDRVSGLKPGQALVSMPTKYGDDTLYIRVNASEIAHAGGDPVKAVANQVFGKPEQPKYTAKQIAQMKLEGHNTEAPVEWTPTPAAAPEAKVLPKHVGPKPGTKGYEKEQIARSEANPAVVGKETPAVATKPRKPKIVTTMTLKDGRVVKKVVDKLGHNWKSDLHQKMPYDTDYGGAVYTAKEQVIDLPERRAAPATTTELTPAQKAIRESNRLSGSSAGAATAAQQAARPSGTTIVHVHETGVAIAETVGKKGNYHLITPQGQPIPRGVKGSPEAKANMKIVQDMHSANAAERRAAVEPKVVHSADTLYAKAANKAAGEMTPAELRTAKRAVDAKIHPALQKLGLSTTRPRGFGLNPKNIMETFATTQEQSVALSKVMYPGVRKLHERFASEGWTEARLKKEMTNFLKTVAKEHLGAKTDLEIKTMASRAAQMVYSVRGGADIGPTKMAKLFIKGFMAKPQNESMRLASAKLVPDPSAPLTRKLQHVETDYMLSPNPLVRMVGRTVYGALQALDNPEARGRGNLANKALRGKIAFENREIRRIEDAYKMAGLEDEVRKAGEAEKEFEKTMNPQNAAIAAIDTMNQTAIIGMLFLKPSYVSANMIGQAMFALAMHGLNPASMIKSVELQRAFFKGARADASLADKAALPLRTRQIQALAQSDTGGIFGSVEVHGGLSKKVAGGHHQLAAMYSRTPHFRKGPRVGKEEAVTRKQKIAQKADKLGFGLDTPWRDNAVFHNMIVQGFDTVEKVQALLDAEAGSALGKKRTMIARRANRDMVDYGRMVPAEQKFIKRVIFFYPWMKGATIYGAHFAAEHPAQLLALSAMTKGAKEQQRKDLGMLPSFQQGVMKAGTRFVPGLGRIPTIMNPQSISTLGTAGEMLQVGKAAWTGKAHQSELIADMFSPAAAAALSITTGINPATGSQLKPGEGGFVNTIANTLIKTPAPLQAWKKGQIADDIKKGNQDPSKLLLPMTKSEAWGRWLGPGFGVLTGLVPGWKAHPAADYSLNTREARSRAASEARSFATKGESKIMLYKDYRQQIVIEAKRVGVPLPSAFTVALALKAQREASIAVWAAANGKNSNTANSYDRLTADMGLLVRMKKVTQPQAKQMLLQYADATDSQIQSIRRDLAESYFGSVVLSYYRKLLTDAGAKLPGEV